MATKSIARVARHHWPVRGAAPRLHFADQSDKNAEIARLEKSLTAAWTMNSRTLTRLVKRRLRRARGTVVGC